jgi:hypothetical protein
VRNALPARRVRSAEEMKEVHVVKACWAPCYALDALLNGLELGCQFNCP